MRHSQCAMSQDCSAPVTHIGNRGWVYCAAHALDRRRGQMERTRKMRAWELKLIAAGKPLPSYARMRKPQEESK